MNNKMTRRCAGLLAAASMLLACAANGAVYRGTFDPPIFMGTAEFDVPDTCVLVDGWISVPGCGPVDVLSAIVTNQPAPPVLDTLTFAPPTLSGDVWGLWWVDGILSGVDTFLLGPAFGNPGTLFDNPDGYALQFVSGHAPDGGGTPRVNLYECFFSQDFQLRQGSGACDINELVDTATQHPFERLTSAPEPGSLALIAGGMLAGWYVRRRKAAR